MTKVKQMTSEMRVEAIFKEKYIIQRKTSFDESNDDEITKSTEESFEVNYFVFLMDKDISSQQLNLNNL